MRDYTELTVVQGKVQKKHEGDSFRAYPGTTTARAARSVQMRNLDSLDAKNKTAGFWNFDSTNKTTLFRTKGLKDDGCGRFQTSTKPWLDGYDTVREKRHPSLGSTRMNSTVGQAMFNLKRSLPPP